MSTAFEDLVLRGATGSRPAAGKPGRLFYDTTLEKWQRDTGAAWEDCEPAGGGAGSDTTAIHDNVSGEISAITEKITLHNDDLFLIEDSEASNVKKKAKKSNLGTGGSSVLVQHVYTSTGAVATGTTLIPYDDTIPQNTEGDEYMTLAITPTNASNILYIEAIVHLAASVAAWKIAALFQDSGANALTSDICLDNDGTAIDEFTLKYRMVAGTTSATTFKVRGGMDRAGTTTLNGSSGARKLGGVLLSSITIMELTP